MPPPDSTVHGDSPRISILAEQDRLLRAMSPLQKLLVSEGLRRSAWTLKAAWLRSQSPELSADELEQRVRAIFLHAAS